MNRIIRNKDNKPYRDINEAVEDFRCPGPCDPDCPLYPLKEIYDEKDGRLIKKSGTVAHMCHPGYASYSVESVARLIGCRVATEQEAKAIDDGTFGYSDPSTDGKEKTQTIVAIERDGRETRTLAMHLRILSDDPKFDVRDAIKDACTDFVKTEEGRRIYLYNCRCFNWADFEMEVPNSICRLHGFEKINSDYSDIEVDWDEHLVDDSALPEEDE